MDCSPSSLPVWNVPDGDAGSVVKPPLRSTCLAEEPHSKKEEKTNTGNKITLNSTGTGESCQGEVCTNSELQSNQSDSVVHKTQVDPHIFIDTNGDDRDINCREETVEHGAPAPDQKNLPGPQHQTNTMDNDEIASHGIRSECLPLMPRKSNVEYECLRSSAQSKWPIRCLAPFDGYNINAGPGGCTALMFVSNSYNKEDNTTGEIFMIRSGYDSNHFQALCLSKSGAGHFGPASCIKTDEDGRVLVECLFGQNYLMLLSNDVIHGNIQNGVFARGPSHADESFPLTININSGNGGGVTLLLCCGLVGGLQEPTVTSAVYMIRSGNYGNFFSASLVTGEDKWKFEVQESGILCISGIGRSVYAVYHNRECEQKFRSSARSLALHVSTQRGDEKVVLAPSVPHHALLLVLCSHSYGIENSTSAAVYAVSVSSSGMLSAQMVQGSHGSGNHQAASQWTFELQNGQVVVYGPKGFCRYAVMATLQADTSNGCTSLSPEVDIGCATITKKMASGLLAEKCDVQIHVNDKVFITLHNSQLRYNGCAYAFESCVEEAMKSPGLYLVRVFAVKEQDSGSGSFPLMLELVGSPKQIAIQPPGVLYALNCGGPSYHAINDIVYMSELCQYANFSYDVTYGASYKCLGIVKSKTHIPHLLTGSHDGYLYCRFRTTSAEAEDERSILYEIEDIPNGTYTLRFHSVGKIGYVQANGKDVTSKLDSLYKKQKEVSERYHMHQTEAPVTVTNNKLILHMKNQEICGFALLDSKYTEKVKSKAEKEEEETVRQHLCNTLEPLTRSMLMKEMEIVGWSQNLLENASGQEGNLSRWNVTGNWKVSEGGYGTEKSFVTSHMDCIKYQEINLCDYFSPEHLETQPPIQVFEWYKEGCCGGGFYSLTAMLMDAEGNEVKSYTTGRLGTLYKDHKWQQASVIFTEYGPGVRRVSIESFGKDDKYWGGHYGPLISGSVVRVKRDVRPAAEDKFADISMVNGNSGTADRERLVNRVLMDNKDLLDNLSRDTGTEVSTGSGNVGLSLEESGIAGRKGRVRKPREIRVFVSSTFRDMQGERERLIKKTFRELNNLCTGRGVFFTYVDLRWGISSEQTNVGETIAICLQEIERCRPYFICMLGERFGWSQREDMPDELLNNSFTYTVENFPKLAWVDSYRYNTSVTQLEVLHGVLNDMDNAKERSFFYLRSPVTTESIGVSPEELKMYQPESEWHREKVYALRNRIESSGLNTRYYDAPGDVCDLIKQDLKKCIDSDFPVGSEPSALEREMEAHRAFADARCRVYIGRQEYFQKIEDYFSTHKPHPLVILGESGSGKSSLVANWTMRTAEKHPDTFVFLHFIGSSADSASYLKLIKRLYEEIKQYFGLDLPIPSSDAGLIRDLSKWLVVAGSKARCVIVLDALNQLDDGTGEDGSEHDLLWLPSTLPPNVYMLLSTLPGRAFDAVLAAGWPAFKVNPLNHSEKEEIITGYLLEIYGKTLNAEQKGMIISAEQTNNPLYLRVLLDEVRMYGAFYTLTDKIKDYLSARSPAELFAKILDRLEQDMEKGQENRPFLVRDTTTAIWCSNRGMSESELIELLQVKSAMWSPFYLSLVESLVNRNGILNFFHDHLRQAVEDRYLVTNAAKQEGYLRLANFFSSKPLDNRTVVELPFLLAKAGELERLKKFITNLEVFKKLITNEDGKFDLIKSWKMLGDFTEVEKAYLAEVENIPEAERNTQDFQILMADLGAFFLDLGLLDASKCVFEGLLSEMEEWYRDHHGRIVYNAADYSWKKCCVHPEVINVLQRLGTVCQKQDDLDTAESYYLEAISRQNRITSPSEELKLCEGLLGLAEVYYLKENMKEAKKLLLRSRELATHVLGPKHHYVAAIISKLGQMCYKQGRLDDALGYFVQDLKLTRGDVGTAHPRTAGILNDVGLVYDDQSSPLAGQLFEAALAILLDVYGSNHVDVAMVRYNLGAFYFATSYYAKAKFQFTEAHKVFLAFLGPDHEDTVAALRAMQAI